MDKCTVGRNNAKSLWRECGKWSMVRVVAEVYFKLGSPNGQGNDMQSKSTCYSRTSSESFVVNRIP